MIYPIVKYGDPVLEKPASHRHRIRRRAAASSSTTCSSPCTPRTASAWPRRRSASRKHIAVIDISFKEDPDAKLVLCQSADHQDGRPADRAEGCLSLPEFRENVDAPQEGHRPRAGREWRMVREDRRRTAGARLPARDRSPQRQALHQPHQRAEARPDEAQDQEAAEGGRVVSAAFHLPARLDRVFRDGRQNDGAAIYSAFVSHNVKNFIF